MGVFVEIGRVHGESIIHERVDEPIEEDVDRFENEQRAREDVGEAFGLGGREYYHFRGIKAFFLIFFFLFLPVATVFLVTVPFLWVSMLR